MRINYQSYKGVELYRDPMNIFGRLPEGYRLQEMSEYQMTFLCGLIKTKRPKNIVEIGTSAGGLAAVIIECIKMLELSSHVTSVDLDEKCYRDGSKDVGYVGKYTAELIGFEGYEVKCGDVIASFLDEITESYGQIDFLILDTSHRLPGEVLDFLVCLPFLSEDAIVIVHDVVLNLYEHSYAYATGLLFSVVDAKNKYYEYNSDEQELSNIAGFEIYEGTYKHTSDIVHLLTATWEYIPQEHHMEKYLEILKRYYPETLINEMVLIIEAQKAAYEYMSSKNEIERHALSGLSERLSQGEVIIYGAGKLGKGYYRYLTDNSIYPKYICVSKEVDISNEMKSEFDVPCVHIDEAEVNKSSCTVIVAIWDMEIVNTVCNKLAANGFENVVSILGGYI